MNRESSSEVILKQQLAAMEESGAFEWLQEKSKPFLKLMSYYKCAMMEIETKFNVLNEEYAFEHGSATMKYALLSANKPDMHRSTVIIFYENLCQGALQIRESVFSRPCLAYFCEKSLDMVPLFCCISTRCFRT